MRQCLRISHRSGAAILVVSLGLLAPGAALAAVARAHVSIAPAPGLGHARATHRSTPRSIPLPVSITKPAAPTRASGPRPLPLPPLAPAPTGVVVPSAPAAPPASLPTVLATDPKLAPAVVQQALAPKATRVHVIAYGTAADAALRAAGADDVQALDLIGGAGGTIDPDRLTALTADARVDYVVEDAPVATTDTGASASTAPTVDLSALALLVDGMTPTLRALADGKGVGIAVIDSGVTKVPDLGKRVVQVALPDQTGSLDDAYGHGTFVAGVAAGRLGVAPGATVYAIGVDRGGSVYTSDIVAGLTWVAKNARQANIRVVNLSLAETTPSSYKTSALDQAVEAVWKLGIVVVASSGNSGPNSMYYAPANDPFAITVGGTDPNDTLATGDDTVASFSSFGTTPDGFAKPELLAPGRHVVGPEPDGTTLDLLAPDENHVAPGYLRMNGTSFSAPQVAGAVALLAQLHPDWSPNEIKGALIATARPVAGSDAGALDLEALLALTQRPKPANAGLSWSIGPAKQALNELARLNTAAVADAGAYQRAAARYESAHRYDAAADAWAKAADRWTRLSQLVNAASALDRAAANSVAAGDWDDAARAWESAGSLLDRNQWDDWAAISYEYGAYARVRSGRESASVTDWERAGELWETASIAPRIDGAAALRAAAYDWWNAAGILGRRGSADQAKSEADYAASISWTASATWNASMSWTASISWTASATWNASISWTATSSWTTAAGWTALDPNADGRPGDDSATGWG